MSILKVLWTIFLPHSLDFNAFHMTLEYFVQTLEICTNQRGGIYFLGGTNFAESEIFGPPVCISILKVLRNQIHHHSLDLNAFCMIQEYISQNLETIKS